MRKTIIKQIASIFSIQFLLLLISTPLLFIAGCCQNAETYYVPEDFKAYFYFPIGSYWVYKNQFGKIDTLTIKSISTKIDKMNAESCDKYERLSTKYNSTLSGDMEARIVCHDEIFFSSVFIIRIRVSSIA